jgi:hypothetical protein
MFENCSTVQVDYPGELRAGELATLKALAPTVGLRPDDAVIFAGDFNINIRGQPEGGDGGVFSGVIPHATAPQQFAPLRFDTGWSHVSGEGARIAWQRNAAAAVQGDSGDASKVELRDAYEGVNRRLEDDKGVLGSSHNAARVSLREKASTLMHAPVFCNFALSMKFR